MFDIAKRIPGFAVACLLLTAFPAFAQQAGLSPLRGTIEKVEGSTIWIKSREGKDLQLVAPENVFVSGVVKISLSDIKPGSFIGIAGLPQEDGAQKAVSVMLFPPTLSQAVREELEGFSAYDLRPNSTMTNASLDRVVALNDGNKLTVKYKGVEKTIFVTPETPIVALVPGDKSELKPGAKILAATRKRTDGSDSYDAPRFLVGRDGLTPPM
jgi:hypothetical protein